MKFRLLALVMLAAATASPAAFAQSDDLSPARLATLDQQASQMKLSVNHAKAHDIARGRGLVTLKEIKLTKRGNWQIEGIDQQGLKVEMRIDGKDGKVEKLERKPISG